MASNTGLVLNVAVNYGGRLEMVQAVRRLPMMSKPAAVTSGTLTKTGCRAISIRHRTMTSICSFVPATINGSAIFSCGRWLMPSFGLRPFAGLILRKKRLSKLSHPFKAENVAFGGLK